MSKNNNILKEVHARTQKLEFKSAVNYPFDRSKTIYAYSSPQYPKLFMVKMSISGTQQVLGYFQTLQTAARFADMASLFFREYRKGDPMFNFSEAQARFDLENEPEALELLEQIFTALNTAGKLKLKFKSKPISLELRFAALQNEVNNFIADIHRRLDAIEKKTDLIEIISAPREKRAEILEKLGSPVPYDAEELRKEGLNFEANQPQLINTNKKGIKWP